MTVPESERNKRAVEANSNSCSGAVFTDRALRSLMLSLSLSLSSIFPLQGEKENAQANFLF